MFSRSTALASASITQHLAGDARRSNVGLGALCLMAMIGQPFVLADGFVQAAEPQHNIPNFSGYWARPEAPTLRVFQPPESGPGPVVNIDDTVVFKIGDFNSPILLPHAAEAVKTHGDYGRAGEVRYEPWALCLPASVPHALNLAGPIQILQSEDQVTILYQRGQQIRRIDIDRDHPENLEPSWYGHSIGHYEGNSLVVDTVAQDPRSQVDSFGTPKSEAIHVVERYTLSNDRKNIDIDFTVEDPNTFTTVWSGKANYVPVATRRNYTGAGDYQEKIQSLICQENNRDAAGERTIPIEQSPDY